MSTATVGTTLITGEELARIPDLEPCELIDGLIVPMYPTGDDHGAYELNVGAEVRDYVKSHQLGKVRVGEVGIYIKRNPDTVRAADVVFLTNERYAQKTKSAFLEVAPDLVAEIMSPNDSFSEVNQKLRDYFSIGVRLVWVLEPGEQRVYAYRSLTDVRDFGPDDLLPGDDVLPGFRVKVATLFEL
jgi:Uma2 family endonuclease